MQEMVFPGLVFMPDNAPFLFHTLLKCISGGKTAGVLGWPLGSLDFEHRRALENSVISEYQASVFCYRSAEVLTFLGPKGSWKDCQEVPGMLPFPQPHCLPTPTSQPLDVDRVMMPLLVFALAQ